MEIEIEALKSQPGQWSQLVHSESFIISGESEESIKRDIYVKIALMHDDLKLLRANYYVRIEGEASSLYHATINNITEIALST